MLFSIYWLLDQKQILKKDFLEGRRGLAVFITAYGVKGRRFKSRSPLFFFQQINSSIDINLRCPSAGLVGTIAYPFLSWGYSK